MEKLFFREKPITWSDLFLIFCHLTCRRDAYMFVIYSCCIGGYRQCLGLADSWMVAIMIRSRYLMKSFLFLFLVLCFLSVMEPNWKYHIKKWACLETHKFELISIFFFLKQFFFICCMRDLRSNFAYKPNETPVIQRKKKKKEKEIKSRINYLYQSMMLHWTINTNKLKNKLIV
jgi:hypothetical protein